MPCAVQTVPWQEKHHGKKLNGMRFVVSYNDDVPLTYRSILLHAATEKVVCHVVFLYQ